jgi:hypothetical protein
MMASKTFYSSLFVDTDIYAGGHFFYITYKNKLHFNLDGTIEYTTNIIEEYKWSWPDQRKESSCLGRS